MHGVGRHVLVPRRSMDLYAGDCFRTVSRANHDEAIAEFLLACAASHGRRVRRGLELGCGLALPSMDLAARGIAMIAVDRSPEMVAAARDEARKRRVDVRVVRADMVRYRARARVDLAFSVGLNASHVQTNDDMLRMLGAVAASLEPGGLYVADFELVLHRVLTAPPIRIEPPWLVYETAPAYVANAKEGGTSIEIRFGGGTTRYDPIRQLFRSMNTVVVRRGRRVETIEAPSSGKLYMPLEIRALVAQTRAFDVVGCHAGYSQDAPLDDHPDADRYVMVLRRKATRA